METTVAKREVSEPAAAAKKPSVAQADRQMMHGPALGSHVYAGQLKTVANDPDLRGDAYGHASDIIARLGCRDPLEEMLAMQALWGPCARRTPVGDGERAAAGRQPAGHQ